MQYLSQRLAEQQSGKWGGSAPRDPLAARQRLQILDATEALIAERGCSGTSIEAIVKGARVSSVTFYEHFANKEECFVASFDRAVAESAEAIVAAVPEGLPWEEEIEAGLSALLAAIDADPARARACLVEAQMGGPALRARYDAVLDQAAPKLREGRLLATAPRGLPETVEEATLGGFAWLLRHQLEEGEPTKVEDLLPKLLDVALSPYKGEAEVEHALAAAGSDGD